jgi:hypothetical protein
LICFELASVEAAFDNFVEEDNLKDRHKIAEDSSVVVVDNFVAEDNSFLVVW